MKVEMKYISSGNKTKEEKINNSIYLTSVGFFSAPQKWCCKIRQYLNNIRANSNFQNTKKSTEMSV